MTPKQIAEVGLARLGLPIPMAKLLTIQALADALREDSSKEEFANAVVDWLQTRKLESECLEALCSLLVNTFDAALISRFRHAVACPSIASDSILSLATGAPVLLPSWTNCHSGPVPPSVMLDAEEQELRAGIFVPLIFTEKLEELEDQSGMPFMRQWAFEYKMLGERFDTNGDGHLSYFCGQENDNVGQFVARRGHLARSAYLRVLAYAVAQWNMPAGLGRQFASATLPSEPIFLRLPPQPPPSWASFIQSQTASQIVDVQTMVSAFLERLDREEQRTVMHCSLTIVDRPLCHAELEIFAIARADEDMDPREAIRVHHNLLGRLTPSRDLLRAFVSPEIDSEVIERLGFVPLTLPLLGPRLGYLQSDLAGRVPYVPFSTKNLPMLELVPEPGGAVLRSGEHLVGEWRWWLWNWKPTHPNDWSTPISNCSTLTRDATEQVAKGLGGSIEHVWSLTIWDRKKDYEKWRSKTQFGRVKSRIR